MVEILCAGMVVVDVLVQGIEAMPRPGETGLAAGVSIATGGDAINQAMSLAKLGNRVGLMGLVGGDMQGDFVTAECLARGVDTAGLNRSAPATTTSVVLIGADGERSFLSPRGSAIANYGPEHVDPDLIRPGLKALSIGSLFTSSRFDRQALPALLRRAKAVGAITLADMVMDQQGYGLEGLAEALPLIDYIVPSELEAQIFTGTSEPRAVAAAFFRRGVRNVIVKRGGRGVLAFSAGGEVACPAFSVPVVDTTGAGDNFMAGLTHALSRQMPLAGALRFGSAVAALSIGAVGAGAGLTDLAQVEAFLA